MTDTELKNKLEAQRLAIRDLLADEVGPPPKISPEVAAPFLGRSFRTVYSWLSKTCFIPRPEDCEKILKFLNTVEDLRESWKRIIVLHGTQRHEHAAVKMALYNRPILRILEDGSRTTGKKVAWLTHKTLKLWAAKLEEKKAGK